MLYLSLQLFRGLLLALLLCRGRFMLCTCFLALNIKHTICIKVQRLGIKLVVSEPIAVQRNGTTQLAGTLQVHHVLALSWLPASSPEELRQTAAEHSALPQWLEASCCVAPAQQQTMSLSCQAHMSQQLAWAGREYKQHRQQPCHMLLLAAMQLDTKQAMQLQAGLTSLLVATCNSSCNSNTSAEASASDCVDSAGS